MGIKIGTETAGGFKIGTEVVGGMKVGTEMIYEKAAPAPVDRPGTLRVTAVAGGRRNAGAVVSMSVSDPDGIRSITSMQLLAGDGNTQAIAIARVSATEFAGQQTYNNARWRSASLTVVYVEESTGTARTLTQRYTVG